MNDEHKSKEQLIAELSLMRQQLSGIEVLQTATKDLYGTIDQLAGDLALMQEQKQELQALYAAGRALSATHDLQRGLVRILEELQRVVRYDSAAVLRLHGDRLHFTAGVGMADVDQLRQHSYPVPDDSPVRKVIDRCTPVVVSDVDADASNGWVAAQGGSIRSWLGIPLLYSGRLVGIFSLAQSQPAAYGEQDIRRAVALSSYAAIVVEHEELRQTIEQRTAELEALSQGSLSLTSSLDLQQVLDSIVQSAYQLLHGPNDIHVFLYEHDELSFGSAIWNGVLQDGPVSEPRPGGLTYSVAETGEPLLVEDMANHPLYASVPLEAAGAIAGLPLKIGSKVVGVINYTYFQPHRFSEEELRLLRALANHAAIGIENARLFAAAHQELVRHREAEQERVRLQEEIIRVQAETLAELSTPLIPISEKVLVMPLIGATDQQRAQRVVEALLRGIDEHRARMAIIDITGVPVVDTHVAATIAAAARAVRLLGAEVVLTGIRPEVAETLVGLGVNFRGIVTYSSLQAGVAYSLRRQ